MTPVEIVTQLYAAFGRGDIPAILEHVDDDIRWEQWADNTAVACGVPWMQPRRGKTGVVAFFASLATELNITEFTVLSLMGGERQVAAEIVIAAQVRATGRVYRDEELHLWTFNDAGKVTRLRHSLDTAKHIAVAAGD